MIVHSEELHSLAKSICRICWSISKTYEKSFFSKTSVVCLYYVSRNNFCIVFKLIGCIFRKR